jgi:hypothetical protein
VVVAVAGGGDDGGGAPPGPRLAAPAHSVQSGSTCMVGETPKANGASCSDGDDYTNDDVCEAGKCSGTPSCNPSPCLNNGACSPRRQRHLCTTLHISVVTLYRKYTGWCIDDFNVYG